ncbi:type I polyketide synthase [Stieleria varia]|uniref:Erythronolide synthase, modules 3 and 4 n=1 Tax=Stieleria varia TaxID=2528005 RepID=A0A5C6B3Q4_9BACT|nr:type I polyketide synthase [Stieleria varia]TWU06101.1 Erythronolide synthase, modules 3 and 4 [Stieleria varia]
MNFIASHSSVPDEQLPSPACFGERESIDEPIAIIGIGCRLPGNIKSPNDYWRILCDGVDTIEEVPSTRWDQFKFYDSELGQQGKIITKWGGFVKDIDKFDPGFFGISPREAACMDPQQRLVLESAWEALEDAGQRVELLAGTNVGVFVGVSTFDYGLMQNTFNDVSGAGPYTNTGQALSICANRLSFVMNWKGPSFAVDTACSSSLLACHMAVNSIRSGESSMAMVSGVNFICAPSTYVGFTAMGMLSPDGRCKAFDASANGFVRAEGGCSVLLKPLKQALVDCDRIYALVAGSACNQDGHTPGLTMPSEASQQALVLEACRRSRIEPSQIRYVEAHGTGTPIGDPIEANALGSILGRGRNVDNPCLIGSVKTNIGHLEAGSGIAGLIKAALVLKHRQVPPNVHFNDPNPEIDFTALRLKVPTEMTELPVGNGPAYAGINSFGFGGTNVHVVLREYQPLPVRQSGNANHRRVGFMPISAKCPESLRAMAKTYADAMQDGGMWSDASLSDILYTTSQRRSHHDFRTCVVARDKNELKLRLLELAENDSDPSMKSDHPQRGGARPIAFVFSGQGPQWWAMGRELLRSEPVFSDIVARCDSLIQELGVWSLLTELSRDEATTRINDTTYAQPAIFAIQVGLVELWKSWGIKPHVVVGHSVGEVAAAYAAGILNLKDAVKVIFFRGQTMGVVRDAGAMLAVSMTPDEATKYIRPWKHRIDLAAVNGPSTVTLSGDTSMIAQMEHDLESMRIFTRRLKVNYAFHSQQMDPVRKELVNSLADIRPQASSIPMVSTVTGQTIDGHELGADYWWKNVRQKVLFLDAMNQMPESDQAIFLEISPHPVLAGAIGECFAAKGQQADVVTSLRRGQPERAELLKSLGKLYGLHCSVQWPVLAPTATFLPLPAYPWHKQSYWSESEDSRVSRLPCEGHPILGARVPGSRMVYQGFIDTRIQPFAVDHQIQGHVLMPGTGFLEMGMALGREVHGEGNFVITDVELLKAAFMPVKETLMTHTILDIRTGRYSIETQPLGQPHRPWTVHCTGYLRERAPVPPSIKPELSDVRRRCIESLPAKVFYDFFRRCGFPFGPSFRGLTQIRLGIGEMLGCVDVPPECEADFDDYLFHPAVLDACLQGNFGCFMTHNRTSNNLGDLEERIRKAEIFMPSGYDEVRLYKRPNQRMWTYVRMLERFKDQSSSDVFIFDDDGELIAEIRGFKETLVGTVDGNAETTSGLLYEYEWKLQPHPNTDVKRHRLPLLADCVDAFSVTETQSWDVLVAAVDSESELQSQLHPICGAVVAGAMRDLGLRGKPGTVVSFDAVSSLLNIPANRCGLMRRLLDILVQDRMVERCDSGFELMEGFSKASQSNDRPWLAALRRLFHSHPVAYPQLMLLARCADRLPAILRGELDPSTLLAPDDSDEVREQYWVSSPSAHVVFRLSAQFIASLFHDMNPGRKARILDLKGGSDRLAAEILAALPAGLVEYVSADVSEHGFAQAEEDQENFQYEVIVADDVLCPGDDLEDAIRRLHNRLVPGGVLLLITSDKGDRLYDLTLGLRDAERDLTHQSIANWYDVLFSAGFDDARVLHPDLQSTDVTRSVIVAQRSFGDAAAQADSTTEHQELAIADISDTQAIDGGDWLIFADTSNVAVELAELARQQGQSAIFVHAAESFAEISHDHFSIDPTSLEDYQRLLKSISERALTQVVYLWSHNVPELSVDPASLQAVQTFNVLAPILICQAWTLIHGALPIRYWLASRCAQSVGNLSLTHAVGQTPLWGTGRVVMNEFPHLHCRLVDLGVATENELRALVNEILGESGEDEVALRDEARFVHRLVASSLSKYSDRGDEPGQPYRLHLSDYGALDGMRLRPAELPRQLGSPTLVEVEVHAAALNFSDVMKALGLYPGLQEGFVPVGIECAGVVTKVGDEVTDFQIGDEVVCITPMAISSHTYTDHRLVAHKPKQLTMFEAATLPIAFLTARYALHYVGRMESGEKVLVNAATGGVGLAAIQLAQTAGAELYATAGTISKRELLKFLGVPHVMHSRTLAFADEIREQTADRGVDLILNSLSGEAISKGMSILADYGRFLEIGKRDIYANTALGMRAFRKNVTFAAIDLDRALREKPDLCSQIFREIVADAETGKIMPLPHRVFPATELVDAFRYMSKAKHIGKVVVDMKGQPVRPVRDPTETTVRFRADATYLLTGGLGGLGSHLAQWMADQGARCLVLASRSGVSTVEGQQLVRKLEQRGVRIVIEQVDVSQADQVAGLIRRIKSNLPPLRGIMHAAVVLDDGLILQLDRDRIERVCAPKLNGAWHLHNATQDHVLDFFVCHSSTSSTLGNAGQANYSAANAFLDGLAEYRKSIGQPALTVNWGYLGDLGVAAGNEKLAERFAQQGVRPIAPSEGLPILGGLMAFPINQMSVMRVDWTRLRQFASTMARSLRFSQLMHTSAEGEEAKSHSGSDIRLLVLATAPEERTDIMLSIVQKKVARVLGTRPEKIELDRSLMDLGLDSLMGFELRNWIEGELRVNVPVVELMQGPTVQKLTSLLLAQLEKTETPVNEAVESAERSDVLANHVARLSTHPQQEAAIAGLLAMADEFKDELQGCDSIDLVSEAQLPDDVLGDDFAERLRAQMHQRQPIQCILVTGGTGFLGAYLLHYLLESNPQLQIHCLVRADSAAAAIQRLQENQEKYCLWNPGFAERIHVVLGDVTLPRLGIDQMTYDRLADEVELVLHNAAGISFLQNYEQLKPVNVAGTLEVLRFASHRRIKSYHHVSTLFVFSILDHLELNTVSESDDPSRHEFLFGGYLQTKWVADHLVQEARRRGMPVTIYRPGIITGDSRTGICSDDVISRMLASAIQLGCCPADETRITFTPVDYVGKAIATLLMSRENSSRNYHLVNRDAIQWQTVVRWLAELGYDVQMQPYDKWLEQLRQSTRDDESTMLSGLLPLIPEVRLTGPTADLIKMNFDCGQLDEMLADTGVLCPTVSLDLISTYVNHFVRSGIISPGQTSIDGESDASQQAAASMLIDEN